MRMRFSRFCAAGAAQEKPAKGLMSLMSLMSLFTTTTIFLNFRVYRFGLDFFDLFLRRHCKKPFLIPV